MKLFVTTANKRKIMLLNVSMFLKMLKSKRTLTSSNKRKKKVFKEENSQIFKNNKRIKSEWNFIYKTTITNNDKKNDSTKVLLNDVVEINVINQRFVVVSNFYSINSKLFASHFIRVTVGNEIGRDIIPFQ